MEAQLLSQGAALMLIGMGTVFVFLTLLVGATSLMSTLVIRMQPITTSPVQHAEEVAAITAAIALHRRERHNR